MTAPGMVAEFDDVAAWTAEAVEQLGVEHAIPAACRGSSSPAALAWLAEACELSPGARLLDVGAGSGGPAAWAAKRFGVRPILLEPMPSAGRAASRLFGLPVVTADGRHIPLANQSVEVAWCLGVLCTVADKVTLLSEIHRVLVPGASLGLLVVVAGDRAIERPPEGNHFPTQAVLEEVLDRSGFDLVEQIERPAAVPLSWVRRSAEVTAHISARYHSHPAYSMVSSQDRRLHQLLTSGYLSLQLLHAAKR
ncbi:class I SAM-dependent methyltransferase [Kribbella sp. HUAS MG21]|uniref:Class I SAM-dependent methyltransferase n=1 Tax=Kribbella sp. HUAS MG21 TaxID=3160966 RepID=A0AAU7T7E7_9ACTN